MEEVIDISDLPSEVDLKDSLNNAIATSKYVVPQKESLYLIAKLLQSIKGFENTAEAFEKDLVTSGILGDVVSWKGDVRSATLTDMNMLNAQTPSNQILLHMINSMFNLSKKSNSLPNICPSFTPLCHQFQGKYRPSDDTEFRFFSTYSAKLVDLLSQLRSYNATSRSLQDKILYLQMKSSETSEIIYLDGDDDDSDNVYSKARGKKSSESNGILTSTLGAIGRSKEVNRIAQDVTMYDSLCSSIRADIEEVSKSLSKSGCLLSGIHISNIDSGISWLTARSLGITRASRSQTLPLKRSFIPSAANMQRKLFYNFKHLWTISGHMMNPAYCSVFDRTGNFILTGADDYLVKIWDANRGQLVRTCRGHLGYISLIVVSPDNSLFASACTMGTIRVWRLCDGVCVQVLKHRHKAAINWMKFDPVTSALATAGDDGQCIVWDLSKLIPPEAANVPIFEVLYERNQRATDIPLPSHQAGVDDAANKDEEIENQITSSSSSSTMKVDDDERLGLFEWSRPNSSGVNLRQANTDNTGKLVLQHIRDASFQLSDEESLNVNCLDISPAGDILVTGSEDGMARVWRFGDDDSTVYNFRSARRVSSVEVDLLKDTIPSYEFQRLKSVAKYLLLRLEGHVSPITDIHINKVGDRILTGSCEDGNVRIWSLSKAFTRSVHIVLHLNEDDDEVAAAVQANRGGRRGARMVNSMMSRTQSKTKVYNVCWSNDDTKVITVQSVIATTDSSTVFLPNQSTRLKVWDSMTGDLLRVIKTVSEISSRVLVAHPLNVSIALTSGQDGTINVWDIDQECSVAKVVLLNDDATPSHIVDASFSEDGTRISVTDMSGRLSLLGLDNPDRYTNVRSEQYFSTDYSNIVHDARGFAIDVGTQLPVHEAPVGNITRIDGVAYEEQRLSTACPVAMSKEEVVACMKKIENLRKILVDEMERVFSIFCRHKHQSRSPIKYKSNRGKNLSGPAAPLKKVSFNGRGDNVHTLSSTTTRSESNSFHWIDHDDRPLSSDSSNDSDYVRRRSSSRVLTRRSSSRSGHAIQSRSISRTRSTRARDSSSNLRRSGRSRSEPVSYVDYLDYEAVSVSNRDQRAVVRRSKRNIVVDDDEDEDDDDDSNSSSFDNDTIEITDAVLSEEESSSDSERSVERARDSSATTSRPRSSRTARSSQSSTKRSGRKPKKPERSSSNTQQLVDEEPLSQPIKRVRRKRNPLDRWNSDHIPEDVVVDRAWLQKDHVVDHQYCPQMGDLVVYFPQGHKEILSKFVENSIPPWQDSNLFTRRWPLVECEITGISYEFPTEREHQMCTSVVVVLKLVIMRMPDKVTISPATGQIFVDLNYPRATRNSSVNANKKEFFVKLRNCDCADFLVPAHLFQRSLKLPWYIGIHLKMNYHVIKGDGTIETEVSVYRLKGVKSISPEWPESPWECLHLQWLRDETYPGGNSAHGMNDGQNMIHALSNYNASSSNSSSSSSNSSSYGGNENVDQQATTIDESARNDFFCGPWEAIPIFEESSTFTQIWKNFPIPQLPMALCNDLEEFINKIVAENERTFGIFVDEIDLNETPDYGNFIHVPLHLDLIRRRIRNQYYRQIEALEHDIVKMYENCELFNGRLSELTKTAYELKERLLNYIRPVDPTAENESKKRKSDISDGAKVDYSETQEASSKRPRRGALLDASTQQVDSNQSSRRESRHAKASEEMMDVVEDDAAVTRVTRSHRHVDHVPDNLQRTSSGSSNMLRLRFSFNGADNKVDAANRKDRSSSRNNSQSIEDNQSSDEEAEHERLVIRFPSRSHNTRNSKRLTTSSKAAGKATSISTRRKKSRVNYAEVNSDEEINDDEEEDEEEADEEEETQRRPNRRRTQSVNLAVADNSNTSTSEDSQEGSPEEEQDGSSDSDESKEEEVVASNRQESRSRKATRTPSSDNSNEDEDEAPRPGRTTRNNSSSSTNSRASKVVESAPASLRSSMFKVLAYMDDIDSKEGIFAEPVDVEEAPNYYDIIQKPVDRATIRYNVKTRRYSQLEDLVNDVLLIYENCETFNNPGSYFVKEACRQRNLILKFLKEELQFIPPTTSNTVDTSESSERYSLRRRDHADTAQFSSPHPQSSVSDLDDRNTGSSRRSADRRRNSETRNSIPDTAQSSSSSLSAPAPWSLRTRQPTTVVAAAVAATNTSAASSTPSDDHISDSFNGRATRSTRLSSSTSSSQVPAAIPSQSQSSSSNSHRSNHNVDSNSSSNSNSNSRNMLAEVMEDRNRSSTRRLDPEMKREMLKVISHADDIDAATNIFSEPVRLADAPNYFEVVQYPMDRSTIRSNILSRVYNSVDQVVRDVMLMYENCDLYNDSTSKIGREAGRQKKLFKSFLGREL